MVPHGQAVRFGSALNFDGIDDQVKISNATRVSQLLDMTLGVWVNPRSGGGNGAGGGHILGKSDNPGAARFALSMGAGSTSVQFNAGYTTVGGQWKTPAGSLPLNSWHYVAVVYTHGNPNKAPSIYIDGVLQNLTVLSAPSGTAALDDQSFYIGSRGINNSRVFDGLIDDVRVYNRRLKVSEIRKLGN